MISFNILNSPKALVYESLSIVYKIYLNYVLMNKSSTSVPLNVLICRVPQ
jgi:hypothetical protein